jgi:small subunit ribosomal protein S19
MSRSVWKGPYVHPSLLKKVEVARKSEKNVMVQTYSRSSTILPHFVGITIAVYNGQKFVPVVVGDDMIGHKLGEFAPTRTYYGHGADKKAKR